ncbi:FecR domain-containing protein [Hymenobacter sp. BT683]|uniref:FecR domain-containing protein n=1 Tax=Hymenobacter jeongseonensis TaxID=2791027 RepID=A0ABS0ILQ6_9BACT|nr:FecR domain-containing protein [Hymenobacter jeongseonensis]MBF9239278.1 FecR domain-containing protein [Hymenobacter jeongseonensis]
MDTYYWDLAARQFANTATAAELETLRQWRAVQPAHEAQYQQQKQLWLRTAPPAERVVDTDAAWQQVSARLPQPATRLLWSAGGDRAVAPRPTRFWPVLRLAASLVVALGLGWLMVSYFRADAAMQVVQSGDQRREVWLPDSSCVWLNRGSVLTYAAAFDGAERVVQLEGEAFFEVRRNPQQPFVVRTGQATTRVLGTSFNLSAYPNAPAVSLTVATGKVAFSASAGGPATLVTPGYGARLDKRDGRLTKRRVTDGNAWAWQSGQLRFAAQPLRAVLPTLEQYYGVQLPLADTTLARCRFTGTFDRAPLSEVLQVLEATLQLRAAQQTAQVYQLEGPGCR